MKKISKLYFDFYDRNALLFFIIGLFVGIVGLIPLNSPFIIVFGLLIMIGFGAGHEMITKKH